ncbi:MAG: transcription termination factor Rho [Lachnospiraceae bacterium]|nr:transcription termination factor Rho [Lachnospiraceae bacterium]
MREKYESLQLVQLKELAKARGLKGISIMKKADLIDLMLAEDEIDKVKAETAQSAPVEAPKSAPAKEEAPKSRTIVKVNSDFQRKPESRISYVRNESQSVSRVEGGSNRYEGSGNGNYSRSNVVTNTGYRRNDNVRGENITRDNKQDNRNDNADVTEAIERQQRTYRPQEVYDENQYPKELDSGVEASGILEVMPDGYGFIRCENYMPGENDVYVAPSQIRRFGLKTGDILRGNKKVKTQQEKFSALLFVRSVNGYTTEETARRMNFEDMTPIFPDERINLETPGCSVAMRVMDLISPVGKGQRGMIVSPPKAGKTTLLKEVAKSILRTNPHMHMLILLIDERPEEVTDIKEAIAGENVEVIYSTFDELPEHHKRVSEMVIERAKRLVEHKKDVVILIDSITRLTRAYNQVVPPSGRTLSGGLDPSALHMPKRFFGAARNMREGGSLTILATALVDTGSKMDDVVYEEFKGTGNMEMILDRKLSEKRIFPAIDISKSGTRREDLLLTSDELDAINIMRKALNGLKPDEAADKILDMFSRTRNNREFVSLVRKNRFL